MTAVAVQTKCGCGHSAAAHRDGPCVGVDVYGRRGHSSGAIDLCECPALRDTYTVPAASAPIPVPAFVMAQP